MVSNADFAKAILKARALGASRCKPGKYLVGIIASGVKDSTRDDSTAQFFQYQLINLKTLEGPDNFSLGIKAEGLKEGEEFSSVVMLPGENGMGYREVKTHLEILTGLTDDDFGAQAKDEDGKNLQIDGKDATVIESLMSPELSKLSGMAMEVTGSYIIDKKTKAARVDKKGSLFVKMHVVRPVEAEELAKLGLKFPA